MVVELVASSCAAAAGQLGGNPTITKPGSVADGHFLLAFVNSTSGATNGPAAPSGWLAGPLLDTDCRLDYKFASGEPGSWAWDTPGVSNGTVIFAAFSGVDTSNPFGDVELLHTSGNGNIDIPSVDATLATLYLVSMAQKAANGTFTHPSGMTEDFDATTSGAFAYASGVAHETLAAGASGTKTWDPSNTGTVQLFGANILLRDKDAVSSSAFLSLI
jgi:hypothetical protein